MEEDPLRVLEKECQISGSQEHILSHSHFARQDDFPSPSPAGDDWPEFSSSDDDDLSPEDNNVAGITICSPPETPEPQQKDDVVSTPLPEEFKTPPEVAAPTSASSDDVVSTARSVAELGFSEERERAESSEVSPAAKRLKGSDDLGFPESTREVEETEVLGVEEERENVEQTLNGGNTEVVNDVVDDSEEEERENEKLEVSDNGKLRLNSKEDGMKFLWDALSKISGVNQEVKKDESYDILETAKQRGLTFPRSRWYDRE